MVTSYKTVVHSLRISTSIQSRYRTFPTHKQPFCCSFYGHTHSVLPPPPFSNPWLPLVSSSLLRFCISRLSCNGVKQYITFGDVISLGLVVFFQHNSPEICPDCCTSGEFVSFYYWAAFHGVETYHC